MRNRPVLILGLLVALGLVGCNGLRPEARHHWLRPMNERAVEDTEAIVGSETDPGSGTQATTEAPGPEPEADLRSGPISTIPSRITGDATTLESLSRPSLEHPTQAAITAQDTGYYDPRQGRGWNAVAIIALPVALIGVGTAIALESTLLLGIAGVVALTLGLIGGRRARDRERRGKGFAIPAMIIGVGALLLTFLALVAS